MPEIESNPTATEQEQTPTQNVDFEWIRPDEGVIEVYGDYVHVNWTALTIRIRLTQLIADPRENPSVAKWVVDERAVMTMPWFTAKILRDLLVALIDKYERINGEIKLPQMPQMP